MGSQTRRRAWTRAMATVAVLVVVGSVPAASGLPTQVSVQVTQKKVRLCPGHVVGNESAVK